MQSIIEYVAHALVRAAVETFSTLFPDYKNATVFTPEYRALPARGFLHHRLRIHEQAYSSGL